MPTYFSYTSEATDYLSSRDRRLGRAIAAVEETCGHILRETDEDLFSAVIHHIVGQQISSAAQRTVWERLRASLGSVCPERVDQASAEELQSCGMTFKKAEYIHDIACKTIDGTLDLEALRYEPDEVVLSTLQGLRGIGRWTAEMLLIHCYERPDVISYGDAAIRRGLCTLKHIDPDELTKQLFDQLTAPFHPYGTTASIYLWWLSKQ